MKTELFHFYSASREGYYDASLLHRHYTSIISQYINIIDKNARVGLWRFCNTELGDNKYNYYL